MLYTNLSTRPFYNERAVHVGLALAAVVVLAFTVFNVTRVVTLSRRSTELNARAEQDEARARDLTSRTAAIRGAMNAEELKTIAAAAREANAIIDQRTFSWTELFNRIEATLPPGVMLTSVRPEIEDGVLRVSMVVLGRRVEDVDDFMEKLEATGAFVELLSTQEELTDDGMYRTVLRGSYKSERGTSSLRVGGDRVNVPPVRQ